MSGMNQPSISYKNHRFPPQVIAHAVWLYFRFPLSLRLVEEMLLERGISTHSRDTWLLEMPPMPIALARSSTDRVETPWI